MPSRPHDARAILRAVRAASLAAVALLPGCIPYTVGSTAQPVPAGETRVAATLFVIPNAIDVLGDSVTAPIRGIDLEARHGLTRDVDVGLRIPSSSGAVVTVKRRMVGAADPDAPALAVMAGAGLVNWGEHAEAEASLLASGPTRHMLTPYGGLRVVQVAPLGRGAPHDDPTAGAFLGLRIGSDTLGVSPELGVFYDPSALHLRDSRFIFVPAITVHGAPFVHLLTALHHRTSWW